MFSLSVLFISLSILLFFSLSLSLSLSLYLFLSLSLSLFLSLSLSFSFSLRACLRYLCATPLLYQRALRRPAMLALRAICDAAVAEQRWFRRKIWLRN